jgi:hypothetical protein
MLINQKKPRQLSGGYLAITALRDEMGLLNPCIGFGKIKRFENKGYCFDINVKKKTHIIHRIPRINFGIVTVFDISNKKLQAAETCSQQNPYNPYCDFLTCTICTATPSECICTGGYNGSWNKEYLTAYKEAVKKNSLTLSYTINSGSYQVAATGPSYV